MTQHIPSTLTQWLTILDGIIFRQHREPLAFFDDLEGKKVSRFLWAARVLLIFAFIILLRNVVSFGDPAWVEPFMRAVGAGLTLLIMLFGGLIMVTQTWRLWLLYLFSPPWLLLLLSTGLADATTTIELGLPVVAVLSFAFGVLLADAVALRFYKWAKSAQSERERQRLGGIVADLPILAQWGRVRTIRLIAAALLILAALFAFFQSNDIFFCVFSLFAAVGCTHFDATVFACFRWPLVKALTPSPSPNLGTPRGEQSRGEQWRATYIGRHALLVPQTSIARAITPHPSAADASAALLALLREGCLGPQVRKTCANMSPEHLSPLLLHLSLQEGGAEAIRYLEPALLPPLHHVATRYAKLASEAAKPPDLQRWIGLLSSPPQTPQHWEENEGGMTATQDLNVSLILGHAHEALLQYEHTPIVDQACQEMRQIVETLYDGADTTTSTLPLSWPVALLKHLEQHRQRF